MPRQQATGGVRDSGVAIMSRINAVERGGPQFNTATSVSRNQPTHTLNAAETRSIGH
jgi:hypothetical protein